MEQNKCSQSLPHQMSPTASAPDAPYLDSRYKLLGRIGDDANGPLHWGRCLDDNRSVAIRVFNRQTAPISDLSLHDSLTLLQLIGPREILKTENHIPFAVMNLPVGICLEALLSKKGILPVSASLQIALQVALVVRSLHVHDVVHGHVNAQNIFINKTPGGALNVQLLHHEMDGHPAAFNFLSNLSPELCAGRIALFESDDIWSIGVLLHRMLLGKPPFSGESQADICSRIQHAPLNLPRAFRRELHQISALLNKMLSKNPSERYNGIELNLALKSLLADRRDKPDSVAPLSAKPLRERFRVGSTPGSQVASTNLTAKLPEALLTRHSHDKSVMEKRVEVNQKGPTRPMQMWSELSSEGWLPPTTTAVVIDDCDNEPSFEELETTAFVDDADGVTDLSSDNNAETRRSIDTRRIAKQEQWKAKQMSIIKRAASLVTKKKNKHSRDSNDIVNDIVGDIVTVK